MTFNKQSSNCHQHGCRAPIWFSLVAMITFSDCALCNNDPTQPTAVHFSSGEVTLAGSLFGPTGKGPHPGVVLIGGSGSAGRDQLRVYAEHLCSLGFRALTYDKRGSGESGGDWTEASLDNLTDDAAAAITYLKKLPQADTSRVGVWGVSQAGWIIPILAARLPQLSFAIVVTGGGATPREVEMTSYEHALDEAKIVGDDRHDAEALLDVYFAWLQTGFDRTGLLRAIEQDRAKSWYSLISLDRILPSDELRPKWEWVARFDPLPLIKKMRMPVLVLLGEKDHLLPVQLAADRWRNGLAEAGNAKSTVKILPGVNHGGRLGETHSLESPVSPEYFDSVKGFLTKRVGLKKG